MVLALAGATAFSGKAIIVKLSYRYGVDAVTVIMWRMLMALPFFLAMSWWASRQTHARDNPLTRLGVPTAIALSPTQPTRVNYIQGVARIPSGFDGVQKLEVAPGAVTFLSTSGQRVTIPVHHEFVRTGTL
jgi:hypothetical protein